MNFFDKLKAVINSPSFHNHLRTWTIVFGIAATVGLLYLHGSRQEAAQEATAAQIVRDGQATQSQIKTQIDAVRKDTAAQVADIQSQVAQVKTVAQAIASIKSVAPTVQVQPIVTQPSTATIPAKTTEAEPAKGSLPVATITGDALKSLADTTAECKVNAVKLDGCQKELALQQESNSSLKSENTELKKVKIDPVWRRTLKGVGQFALGVLAGRAIR